MLLPKLIPQSVEPPIMVPPLIVRQLMQHGIDNLLERQEQIGITVVAQTDADLVAAVDVQPEQVALGGQELGQNLHSPPTLAHDRLDRRGHFTQQRERRVAARQAREVLVGVEEGLVFFQ